MKNDYKVLLYPAKGKPFWAYYRYDTLAKARDYAQEIVKGLDEKDPNRKVKSEIYAGDEGSYYFTTLVETYHWKKEANEVRRIDTVDSIVDDFMRYVRKTPPLQNVSITTAYATKLSRRLKEAHKREVEELRKCLKEAVFVMQTLFDKKMTRWRKVLEGANYECK